jgi:hypothetical protein
MEDDMTEPARNWQIKHACANFSTRVDKGSATARKS